MRGFQIWSQSLNQTTFDPLFDQEMVVNWISLVFDRFCQKEGQMLSNFNLKTRFRILSSFVTPFVKIIKFRFFGLP